MFDIEVFDKNSNLIGHIRFTEEPRIKEGVLFIEGDNGICYGYNKWGFYKIREVEKKND